MTDFVYQGEDFDQKVIKQVEFYFSDSNLQTDIFLFKIYQANDGWVELKTILTFGRMKQYRPEERVIEALKKSDKLELSANNDMIKRKEPLKDFNELKNTRKRNTIHIEGFPKDLTQEALESWFNEKIATELPNEKVICCIRRIKNRFTKEFLGIVDVEFKTQEDTEYVLNTVELSYPEGIVSAEGRDKKDLLKKMSLLTFQEMREGGKRKPQLLQWFSASSKLSSVSRKKFKKDFKGKRDNRREFRGSRREQAGDENAVESTATPEAAEQPKQSEEASEQPKKSEESSEQPKQTQEATEQPKQTQETPSESAKEPATEA
ncbi:uncharacterized protein J8A68_004106 [[Candida] subhashii]|uniref:HTH La-type RNA-binding domain-containing protein n=1 Tax=[Candida] subhashii TaxID=561895 RepID=A0A8J5QTC3_9ASCO|nr:uncharacterized protein J8A68_004106 [[Candida] subhashii]KAG7662335.1 hypothetical protein J8A68_004106 [[Candida] subhashii]